MQNYRTISTIKIVAAVALLATSFVAYDFFFTGHASAVDTAANSATSTLPAIVATIDGINLDVSLFDSEAFTSLQDFTVVLTPQAIGRDNPFASVPGSAPLASQNTAATSTAKTAKK